MTTITILIVIILLLVASQARDSWIKSDRAEENRAATMEGMRKGWDLHRELTHKTVEDISELYRKAHEGLHVESSVQGLTLESILEVEDSGGEDDEVG